MGEGKKKLTLSVDGESVQRARALGINISDLTEQVLRSFTLKAEDIEENALQIHRESLFREMTPMLKRLNAVVVIGGVDDPNGNPSEGDFLDVVLTGEGKSFVLDEEQDPETGEMYQYHAEPGEYGRIRYSSPEKIVQNFMKAVESAKTKRGQEIASYLLARRIVEAIAQVETKGENLVRNRASRPRRRKAGEKPRVGAVK